MWSSVVMVDEAVASLDKEVADRVCCHGNICGIHLQSAHYIFYCVY